MQKNAKVSLFILTALRDWLVGDGVPCGQYGGKEMIMFLSSCCYSGSDRLPAVPVDRIRS